MKPRDLTALVRHAEDEQTARHLETLLQDSANVRVHGTVLKEKTVMELHLFGYRFRLQRNCAPAALDTLYDIFIGREHQLAPGFDGMDARTVVDVGANEGYYVLQLKRLNPALTIYAFEPNPRAADRLEQAVADNGVSGIHLVRSAVSDVSADEPFELVDEISSIGGFRIWGYRPWLDTARIEEILVPTVTLDEALEGVGDVDLMKIDVEGAEYRVLKGAQRTLSHTKRIVVECHGAEMRELVERYLTERGFERIMDTCGNDECGDLYFVRTET